MRGARSPGRRRTAGGHEAGGNGRPERRARAWAWSGTCRYRPFAFRAGSSKRRIKLGVTPATGSSSSLTVSGSSGTATGTRPAEPQFEFAFVARLLALQGRGEQVLQFVFFEPAHAAGDFDLVGAGPVGECEAGIGFGGRVGDLAAGEGQGLVQAGGGGRARDWLRPGRGLRRVVGGRRRRRPAWTAARSVKTGGPPGSAPAADQPVTSKERQAIKSPKSKVQSPKSKVERTEVRNPKEARNPKSEVRKIRRGRLAVSDFGLRVFGLLSGFGLRVSGYSSATEVVALVASFRRRPGRPWNSPRRRAGPG